MTDSTRTKKALRKNTRTGAGAPHAAEAGWPIEAHGFQAALIGWYRIAGRELPWRAKLGEVPDPYRVWLSEIMLQQTTVKAVRSYYAAFTARWPTVAALAHAPREEVMAAWAGLGYYSRARNLHACAPILAESGFPTAEADLLKLPGVGSYTAAAIASIAFGERATVVDGNVERVIARLYALQTPLPAAKAGIRQLATGLTPEKDAGDYAQAMMDLGATVCTPRSPSCLLCPVQKFCRAAALGQADRYPVKLAKANRPVRTGTAHALFRLVEGATAILLRRRPDCGLLGGMLEVPSTPWTLVEARGGLTASLKLSVDKTADRLTPFPPGGKPIPHTEFDERGIPAQSGNDSLAFIASRTEFEKPAAGAWYTAARVKHTFTHFDLELNVVWAEVPGGGAPLFDGEEWADIDNLDRYALPTVMRKAIASAIAARLTGGQGSEASSASRVSTVDTSARPSTRPGRK